MNTQDFCPGTQVRINENLCGYRKGDMGVVIDRTTAESNIKRSFSFPESSVIVFVEGRESSSGAAPYVIFQRSQLKIILERFVDNYQIF